jgi:hypothetical protein
MHGLLGGLVLFSAKLVLCYSGHWTLRLAGTYSFLSFMMIIIAMVMGNSGEKKLRETFGFWQAWVRATLTMVVVVFISMLGDQVAYRTKAGLAEQTKVYNLEQLEKGMSQVKLFKGSLSDQIIEEAEAMPASQIYSIGSFFANLVTFSLLNAFWALIVAAFTRKKVETQELV